MSARNRDRNETPRSIRRSTRPPGLTLLTFLAMLAALAGGLAFTGPAGAQEADFGDAPDNTHDAAVDAYPGVPGRFPTLLNTLNGLSPGDQGVHHTTVNGEWLAVVTVPDAATTVEADALLVDGDADDALVEIVCDQLAPLRGAILPLFCGVLFNAARLGEGLPEGARYVNVLVDVDRDGRWRSASPLGTFPREHVVINEELVIPAGEARSVMSGLFIMPPGRADPVWVRVTLTREPAPVLDQDGDSLPDLLWTGTQPPGDVAAFGETEDHLLRPALVHPKEPRGHFELAVHPNPVRLRNGVPLQVSVDIVREADHEPFQRVSGYTMTLACDPFEAADEGFTIRPAPGWKGVIPPDAAIRTIVPIPSLLCGPPPCLDAQAVFTASLVQLPARRQRMLCSVKFGVEPDGEFVEYADWLFATPTLCLIEDGLPDADGDCVPDDVDQCQVVVAPSDNHPRQGDTREDLDGFQDDDGCPDEDNDLDGVPDTEDLCPLDREDGDGVADDDGCPDPKTLRLPFTGTARGGEVLLSAQGPTQRCTVVVVTQPGESADAVMAKLAAAINDDPCMRNQGFSASPSGDALALVGVEVGEEDVVITLGDAGLSVGTPPLCDLDVVPAATLLLPYFEVDLDDPNSLTTLFAINNADSQAHLAHVTLWTDLAVPTLTFDVYLSGNDVQTINLRDVLARGRLPSTGSGVSHRGDLSGPNAEFAGCNPGTDPGEPPLYATPALDATTVAHLQAWHTGGMSPLSGDCAGADHGDNVARGYVTIDAANACSILTPADDGYFAAGGLGIAANDNVLFGDVFLVDSGQNFAQGEPLVHIRADRDAFAPGEYTFYARYVDGDARDARQPLGRSFAVRYLSGGAFSGGTQLRVWRDPKVPSEPFACGGLPAWAPLPEAGTIVLDEEENATVLPAGNRFPWATQSVAVGGPALPVIPASGLVRMDLDHPTGPLFGGAAQAWVSAVMSAEDRYSLGLRATTLVPACGVGNP